MSVAPSKSVEWATPQKLFEELTRGYIIGLDVCATHENTKAKRFFTREENGLMKDWKLYTPEGAAVWMNPPYGREITQWVHKASYESSRGLTVIGLLPAHTDTAWWHEHIQPIINESWPGEVKFLRGRVKFIGPRNFPARFSSVCVYWKRYL